MADNSVLDSLIDSLGLSPWARRVAYAFRNRRNFDDLYQHDRMLADQVRIDTYRAAFAKHVKPGDVVVDLGTGTGVLAFLAARAGARVVHAVEHGPMLDLACAVARDNGITNVVFHRCHSTRFALPEPADVIIHEQIGDAAFDERAVENLVDLRGRILKPGGLILPNRIALFVEPVQLIDGFDAPFAWQQQIDGINFRKLAAHGSAQLHSYRYRAFRPFPFDHFLCQPEFVAEVDLTSVGQSNLPREISYERAVVKAGRFDGFCVYITANFDDELSFTSSPESRPTNWANALLRVEPRPVEIGERISLRLAARDLADPETWRWNAT